MNFYELIEENIRDLTVLFERIQTPTRKARLQGKTMHILSEELQYR